MPSHTWWYTARAAGIIAWALVSLTLIGGLQLSTRLVRRPAPAWVLDVHRFAAGLCVALVGVHLLGLALDPFVKFGLAELFVPQLSSYRPGAVSLGIVALYLLLAIELTSLAMRRLSRRVWHSIHLSSYPLFALATVHGLTAGTDRRNALFQWACLLTASLVLFMTLVRILAPRRGSSRPPQQRHDRAVIDGCERSVEFTRTLDHAQGCVRASASEAASNSGR